MGTWNAFLKMFLPFLGMFYKSRNNNRSPLRLWQLEAFQGGLKIVMDETCSSDAGGRTGLGQNGPAQRQRPAVSETAQGFVATGHEAGRAVCSHRRPRL